MAFPAFTSKSTALARCVRRGPRGGARAVRPAIPPRSHVPHRSHACRATGGDGQQSQQRSYLASGIDMLHGGPAVSVPELGALSIEAETEEALQAAAQRSSGGDLEALRSRLASLQALLPDMGAAALAATAHRARWEQVAARLGDVQARHDLDTAHDEVHALIAAASREACADAEAADVAQHARVIAAVSAAFADARASPQPPPVRLRAARTEVLAYCGACRRRLVERLASVVAIAGSSGQVVEQLLALRSALPGTNVSRLVLAHPPLLRHAMPALTQLLQQAREQLGQDLSPEEIADVLEVAPFVAEPGQLQQLLSELQRAFPDHAPGYILLQHVRVGGSEWLDECRRRAARMAARSEEGAEGAAQQGGRAQAQREGGS